MEAAGSEVIPVIAAYPKEDLQNDESVQILSQLNKVNSNSDNNYAAGREKTFEGDIVNVPHLVDSGTQFFDDVNSPYESYEYYSDDNSKFNDTETSQVGHRRGQTLKRSVRQVVDYYTYDDSINDYYYGQRKRSTLRSRFARPSTSSTTQNPRNTNSRSFSSSSLNSDYDEYYYDDPAPPPPPSTTTTTTTTTRPPKNRYRGRISPTTSTSRQTPFTLTNPNTRTSSFTNNARSSSNTPSFARRSQSRYVRPTTTESTTTSAPQRASSSSSRFRSRFRSGADKTTTSKPLTRNRYSSSTRGRGNTLSTSNIRGYNNADTSNDDSRSKEMLDLGTITVTHYIPHETTIPIINGKVTEFRTVLTPSASTEILGPNQYTNSEYQGKSVLVLTSDLSSTPSIGVTEVTRYLIRESSTTSINFTPTTIRGRKTSFSQILPSTVYSIEPITSTITTNPLSDSNQLTNLLLNQLLGNLNLNQNGFNNLQQQQLLQNQQQQQQPMLTMEPATPFTQYNTKTTSYVTTVTDKTSTILPITLHGKLIKTTIVESSTNIITATEFITESTVITPTQPVYIPQTVAQPQLQQQGQLNGINPALLQGLFQQQQQLVLKQQLEAIQPTQPAQMVQTHMQISEETAESRNKQEEMMKLQEVEEEKPSFSVITIYVSGKSPGEFSTILSTVPFETNKVKRSIASFAANSLAPSNINDIFKGEITKVAHSKVIPTSDSIAEEKHVPPPPYDYEDPFGFNDFYLDDSYSYSDALGSTLIADHSNKNTVELNNDQLLQTTQRLDSLQS